MKLASLVTILAVLVITGCSKQNTSCDKNQYPFVYLDDCTKPAGEDVKLCFVKVIEDSRCPENANCIWGGVATGSFIFTNHGRSHRFSLSTLQQPPTYSKSVIVDGYKIELINITPYPKLTADPAAGTTRAEVKITRN